MAKSKGPRYDCRALPYLEPRPRPDPPADLDTALLRSGSQSPARAAVQARSDLTVTTDLVTRFVAEGLDEPTAVSAAYAVLTEPTVAARRAHTDNTHDIIQSVILESDQATQLQVTVYLRAVPGSPPTVELKACEAQYVDLTSQADASDLVECVERWWAEYPMPNVRVPEPFPLQEWAWFGNPNTAGIRDVPADWRDRLKAAGAVYGVPPFIAETMGKVTAQHLGDRVDFVFVAVGTKWAADFNSDPDSNDITVETVGDHAETFEEVMQHIRADLLSKATTAVTPPPRSRSLEPGEIVYHRKVGGAPKFDYFDAGSDKACIHGSGAFIGWSGDKATKGMARRYDNFTPNMLIHCNQKMNCGMYGVNAARGGVKLLPTEPSDATVDGPRGVQPSESS